MEFLRCIPSVFVIGDEYEILVNVTENGIIAVEIGGETYFEENAGPLSSEKTYAKIRVPQSVLDAAAGYTVVYRRLVNRKAYRSELSEPQSARFDFKPLTKTENINIYHIADVHYRFDFSKDTAKFFGDDLDLLIANGDIGEVENFDHYVSVAAFIGEMSGGRIPVVFVRGNHDTRGRMAEFYPDYFPAEGKKTYFTFTVGSLRGIALDCGEDKTDDHPEYAGVNDFAAFRRRETAFLESLPADGRFTFAVSHICPAQPDEKPGSVFDIEAETYRRWNDALARLGVKFMLCGHMHEAYILEKNDPRSLRPHEYPVVVGSYVRYGQELWGAALTLTGDRLTVRFTDQAQNVREEHVLDLTAGKCAE